MSQETELMERMDRLESQITPLVDTANALGELRKELAPRVNEAVHALIVELADVAPHFQLEDLVHLLKNIMRNIGTLNFTLDQLKNLIDFLVIAEPVLKTSVPKIIYYFDELEQKGIFRILTLGLEVLKSIGSVYSPEELQQIGDGLVRLVGMLHKLLAPESLDLLERAAALPGRTDLSGARPVGLLGLMGALSDPRLKVGLGVALELTRGLAALQPEGPAP
jgi:uncharacterized protein YjgD (DUF1641 family)